MTMEPMPNSPKDYCNRLGLQIDLSWPGSPAIVGPSGKHHYYAHGRRDGSLEMCDILARLERMRESAA